MTGPEEHPTGETGPHEPPPTGPTGDELDALVHRLRTEPVDVDELARERRISAALEAASYLDPEPVPQRAPIAGVPAPRRRAAGRTWLVAAAVLAVVGVGGYLVAALGTGSGDDAAESADSAAVTADEDTASAGSGAAEQLATTTAVPPDPTELDTVPLPAFLGSYPDAAALRTALDSTADGAAGAGPDPASPGVDGQATAASRAADAAAACVQELAARGSIVVGLAEVAGNPVLVVRASPPELVDATSCAPL